MKRICCLFLLPALAVAADTPHGVRLKELVSIEGVRSNQLIGYGLVVGLKGTGDRQQTLFSAQSLANLLLRMGVSIPSASLLVKNTAAVMVTATLPPFAQPGATLDATAAAMGDCTNLQGGILILTMLRAANGDVYATAQGPVLTGGFVAGNAQTNQTVNHPTVGRLLSGAIVEHAAPAVAFGKSIRLQLHDADFTTAERIEDAVNRAFGEGAFIARAENSGVIDVNLPPNYSNRAPEFIAHLERVVVTPDTVARVVVNERTGTVTLGQGVHIAPVAIMHGNLSVEIQTTFTPTQPAAFSQGSTQLVPDTQVAVKEDRTHNVVLQDGATVEELVKSLNAIGSTPRDVIDILENLRAAGALDAEVDVI